MKIFVAVRDTETRHEIIKMLRTKRDIMVLGEAAHVHEVINSKLVFAADIVLLDLSFDKRLNLINHILRHNHRINVLAMASMDKTVDLYNTITNGYKGIVFREKIASELIEAVLAVAKNRYYFSANILD